MILNLKSQFLLEIVLDNCFNIFALFKINFKSVMRMAHVLNECISTIYYLLYTIAGRIYLFSSRFGLFLAQR